METQHYSFWEGGGQSMEGVEYDCFLTCGVITSLHPLLTYIK